MQIEPWVAVLIVLGFVGSAMGVAWGLHRNWVNTWPHKKAMFAFDIEPPEHVLQAVRALVFHFGKDLRDQKIAVHLACTVADLEWVGDNVQAAAQLAKGPVALLTENAPTFEVWCARDGRDPQDNLLIHEVAAHIIPYLREDDWNHRHDQKWRDLQNRVEATTKIING